MKTITLMLAAVTMTFAQAAAPASPAAPKDATSATAPVKKHSKKHASKKVATPAPAATATPAAK